MYSSDSFFTLSEVQQLGLLFLSVALLLLWLFGAWKFSAKKPIAIRIGIGFLLFYCFVWLSPQIYYQYYRVIIDGLPAQMVVGWPVGLGHIFRLLSFQAEANLSAHSQGVLGWAIAITTMIRR